MSNYLSVGIVYSNKSKEKELSNILKYIRNNEWKLDSLEFSEDYVGDYWMNITEKITDLKVSNAFFNNFFSICKFKKLVKNQTINLSLTYKKLSENDFGFLVQIESTQIYNTGNRENLKNVEMTIIDQLQGFYSASKYAYIFADDEADLEYTYEQIRDKSNPIYSMLIFPHKDDSVEIILASWMLDGLTSRE